MSQNEKKKFIKYIIFIIFFILFTNNFYTYEQTLLINQYDGMSYMSIANSSHNFSERLLPYHHAQRFFLPYLIGFLGNLIKVDKILNDKKLFNGDSIHLNELGHEVVANQVIKKIRN